MIILSTLYVIKRISSGNPEKYVCFYLKSARSQECFFYWPTVPRDYLRFRDPEGLISNNKFKFKFFIK